MLKPTHRIKTQEIHAVKRADGDYDVTFDSGNTRHLRRYFFESNYVLIQPDPKDEAIRVLAESLHAWQSSYGPLVSYNSSTIGGFFSEVLANPLACAAIEATRKERA